MIYGNHKIYFRALAVLEYWKKNGNTVILKRILQLLQAIESDPYQGIGKPEPLKYGFSGSWSRQINHEQRILFSRVAISLKFP